MAGQPPEIQKYSLTLLPTLNHPTMPTRLPSPLLRLITPIICTVMTSCLDFGKKLELFAPDVTAAHLKQIESLTSIDLPEGTTGLAYHYDASGIDPRLEAKLKIPTDQVAPFLKSKVIQARAAEPTASTSGNHRPWWRPDELAILTQGRKKEPANVEHVFGKQGSDHILYVQWITF